MAQARVQTQAEDGHGGPADGGTEDEGGGGGNQTNCLTLCDDVCASPICACGFSVTGFVL